MSRPKSTVPDVAISSLELVKKLDASDSTVHNKATMIQLYFDAALNEELDVLISDLQDFEIDERSKEIEGPRCRGDLAGVVSAAVSACRREFIAILRLHKREAE